MRTSFFKNKVLTLGAAALLAVGVIGGSTVALADTPPAGGTPPAHSGPGKPGPRAFGFGIAVGIQDLIKSTGVTRDELKQGSDAGLTLGQIIDQYGDKTAAQARTDALAMLKTHLDEAVKNGKLTQEREDDMLAKAGDAIDKLLASKPGDHKLPGGPGGPSGPRAHVIAKNALQTVADVLGTDVKTIVDDLKSGKTIAQIAGDKTPAVNDALTAQANAAIQKLLDAGKIDQAEADKLRANVAGHVNNFINNEHTGPAARGKPGALPNGRGLPPKPGATPTPVN
jgi:hypothetical protein